MNWLWIALAAIGGLAVLWFAGAFVMNFLFLLMLKLFFRGNNGDPLGLRIPCPLHDDCERYLTADECDYRSGRLTYTEAEDAADRQAGRSVADGWAENE